MSKENPGRLELISQLVEELGPRHTQDCIETLRAEARRRGILRSMSATRQSRLFDALADLVAKMGDTAIAEEAMGAHLEYPVKGGGEDT